MKNDEKQSSTWINCWNVALEKANLNLKSKYILSFECKSYCIKIQWLMSRSNRRGQKRTTANDAKLKLYA